MEQCLTGINQGYHTMIHDYGTSRRNWSLKMFWSHLLYQKTIGTGQQAPLQQPMSKFLIGDTV